MKQIKQLEKGFFAFWVVRSRITYLLAFVIAVFGIMSLNSIPKESDPEVNLPMLTVTTKYDGATAETIDDDVTEELEKAIDGVDGISSISATSSEGNSNISIEIKDGYDVDTAISDIETAVDGVALPSGVDSDYPKVTQRDFSSTEMFSINLYGDDETFTFENLLDLAALLQQNTSGQNGIKEVTIDTNTIYDIRVILSKEKLDILGIDIDGVSNTIKNNNLDSPIGSYDINDTSYSFELAGKLKEVHEILDIYIHSGGDTITLGDIARLELYYGEEKINKFGLYNDTGYNYISLTYSKLAGANIFDVADQAKLSIEQELEKEIYSGLGFIYTDDEAQQVIDDFSNLSVSAAQTLILVFLALIFFVGLKESTIATLILPLAFFLGFIVIDYLGETFNQMTTFAFVLAFGIAIDTIIIIIEGAAEKVKQGYSPRTAVLIALREYKSPVIIGTMTTVSAFIPILTLPGIMGIFLAFIPLVVFIILISTLFVSLTIAGPIFMLLLKDRKRYEIFPEREEVMSREEKELLTLERQGKELRTDETRNLRDKIYEKYSGAYKTFLEKILMRRKNRVISTLTPIVLLIICIVSFLGSLGFEIFPQSARDNISITVTGPAELKPSDMTDEVEYIEELYSKMKEIESYTMSISGNKISTNLTLLGAIKRQNEGLLDNTELQEHLTKTITNQYAANGFSVGSRGGFRGPGGGDPVGIFLTTQNAALHDSMVELASDFEAFLYGKTEISDVTIGTANPKPQIEFHIIPESAKQLGVSEREIFSAVSSAIRGVTSGSIKGVSDDHDIKIYFDEFLDEVTPNSIENINIYVGGQTIKAGSVLDYTITKASPSIKRSQGNIEVQISADVIETTYTAQMQTALEEFAKTYDFPVGISYRKGGENEENAELINSVITGVFLAFFFIFGILVYQFNSYGQPAVILYSVFMSLIGVILGLYITGNPLSMPVGVGFISLMGIVVNDAIVMIDKINKNLSKGMELKTSIIEGAVSRLNPILVTTITTVAGILPIALQDVFWAGLGYTVAFGLFTGSFMTLFAVPTLYYSLERRKHKNNDAIANPKHTKSKKYKTMNKKVKYIILAIIALIISVFLIKVFLFGGVASKMNMSPELQEIMGKVRAGQELTPQEQEVLDTWKAENADSIPERMKGGGGGGGMRSGR